MLLSIVMPVYNHLDLTQQAIKNIYETQMDVDFELIIVNDGSTDDTKHWLNQNKKDNWTVIHQENKWTNEAWNVWVSHAKWTYIVVINNDILLPLSAFRMMIDCFKWDEKIMMVCPRSTTLKVNDYGSLPFYFKFHIHWWCYMMDSRVKEMLFPIDKRLRIFGGDNWLYYKMIYMWYKYKLAKDIVIHHMESQTVDTNKNLDRPIFFQIAKEEWRHVIPFELKADTPKEDLTFSLY